MSFALRFGCSACSYCSSVESFHGSGTFGMCSEWFMMKRMSFDASSLCYTVRDTYSLLFSQHCQSECR